MRRQERSRVHQTTAVVLGLVLAACGGGDGDKEGADAGSHPMGDAGVPTGDAGSTPLTLNAKAVGAYSQIDTTCATGSPVTGDALFLCPGGRIRGAGHFMTATELLCGTYTTTEPAFPSCTDKVGCYPKVKATVKDTLVLNGQEDVSTLNFDMLMNNGQSGATVEQGTVWRTVPCNDGSTGYVVLDAVANDVSEDYCVSDACPAPTGGGSGQCGTDCDCGHCWYCEKSGGVGTCRYGGEGPDGCFRGCG